MVPPASTNASRMAKLVASSAVHPNTLPPSASGATSIPLSPIGRFRTISSLLPTSALSANCADVHHLFVKFSDTSAHVGEVYTLARGVGGVDALIAFWSHALAAALFSSLAIWRLGE